MASVFDQARKTLKDLQSKANSAVANINFDVTSKRTAPGIGSTTPNFKPMQQAFRSLPQPVQNVSRQVVNTVANQPLLQLPGIGVKPKVPFSPTVGQYAKGQFVTPFKQLTAPKATQFERFGSLAQLGFNATPMGNAFNIVGGGVAGAVNSIRTGKNINSSIASSMTNPSKAGIGTTGLGIQGLPGLAIDVLAGGNPKSLVKNAASIKNVARSIYRRPVADDARFLDEAVSIIKSNKNLGARIRATANIDQLLKDHIKERVPAKEFEKLMNGHVDRKIKTLQKYLKNADEFNIPKMSFPGMGFVEDAKASSPTQALQKSASTTDLGLKESRSQLSHPQGITATGSTMPQTTNPSSDYIKELVQKQKQAKSVGSGGLKQKAGSVLADLKAKLVDETSPITDVLSRAEKKNKFTTLPSQDVRLQIDRALRSKGLASQFAEDNGLVDAIKKAPDIDELDQYMIAKQAAAVEKQGIKTGRDLVRDQQMVQDLSPKYEQFAQQVNQYSRKLLDYSVKTGLIDKGLAKELVAKYPEYVPLQRVFNELEQGVVRGTGKGVASISRQTVVQKLKGSEREITSPIESLLLKTQDAFSQGERNIAAKQLASYRTLPGFEGLIKEVDAGARAPHTFSYIDNGVKKTFATTPEISAAAKSLNVEQMGILGKILSTPTRMLQLGATGLNIPFVVTNVLKDELTGFINSNKAASTSILNPANYVRSLFSAVKHDELYKDLVRNAGGGTSFDIAREAPNLAVKKIRNPVKFTARNPGELLRAVENVIGRSEEFGRIKNFQGAREAYLKQGRTLQDANLLAAQAARENTANFARRGSFGRVINWMIPFFNAGIQGSRQLSRSFQNAPLATSTKVATTIFTPIAVATAWNMSDPQRKQIYTDIPSYEKENNIIIIPPDPVQDDKGRWNVIKIPLPPGLSNLGTIVRRSLETAEGLDPIKFSEIATNLITAGTSVDVTSGNKLASTFTPQIAKPLVEATTNKNLFTGRDIIPSYLKNQPASMQTKPGVSAVATGIGSMLNVSPLMIENFAQSQLGGLGSQLLGKETAIGNLQRRFGKASGGDLLDKVYEDSDKVTSINSQAKKLIEAGRQEEALNLIRSNKDLLVNYKKVKAIRSQVDTYQEYKNKVKADTRLTPEQKEKVLALIQNKLYELSTLYQK